MTLLDQKGKQIITDYSKCFLHETVWWTYKVVKLQMSDAVLEAIPKKRSLVEKISRGTTACMRKHDQSIIKHKEYGDFNDFNSNTEKFEITLPL
jgi:hypothetical protein